MRRVQCAESGAPVRCLSLLPDGGNVSAGRAPSHPQDAVPWKARHIAVPEMEPKAPVSNPLHDRRHLVKLLPEPVGSDRARRATYAESGSERPDRDAELGERRQPLAISSIVRIAGLAM